MSRMAAPQMRVRMWSWPMVMRSRKVLMTHVMRHQEVAEPRDVPAHSAAMTDGVAVSTFRKVNSYSMQTRVPGLVTDMRKPLRAPSMWRTGLMALAVTLSGWRT